MIISNQKHKHIKQKYTKKQTNKALGYNSIKQTNTQAYKQTENKQTNKLTCKQTKNATHIVENKLGKTLGYNSSLPIQDHCHSSLPHHWEHPPLPNPRKIFHIGEIIQRHKNSKLQLTKCMFSCKILATFCDYGFHV